MNAAAESKDPTLITFVAVRRWIGFIGMLLPFVLAIGKVILDGPGLQSSISAYYHTLMRDVFVGALCAISVFLLTYRGHRGSNDNIYANLACAFGVGIALFPTWPGDCGAPREGISGYLHAIFAAGFFLTLAYFAIVLFRKSDPNKEPTRRKLQRNRVYWICGWLIVACLALIAIVDFMPCGSAIRRLDPVFWLESVAIIAFGVSWVIKGETLLQD